MAFAAETTYFTSGDSSIIGCFNEVDHDNLFEYSENRDTDFVDPTDFPHKVWVTTPREGIDSGFRYAKVMKTRVYICVDEDEHGPIIEKWYLKKLRKYAK
jgi:hypothetical protein